MQGLLAEADMAPDSLFCSSAFQKDLHAFLHAQAPTPPFSTQKYARGLLRINEDQTPKVPPGAIFSRQSCPLCELDWLKKCVVLLQVIEWRKVRERMGLPMAARGTGAQEMAAMAQSLTRAQLQQFVCLCRRRYEAKRVDPGQGFLYEYYISYFEMHCITVERAHSV